MYKLIISLSLGVLASIIAALALHKYETDKLLLSIESIDKKLYLYILSIVLFSYSFYMLIPIVKPYFDMIKRGKYRGLWRNGRLKSLVSRCYCKSSIIKIKVTRGYNLFASTEGLFYKHFFKNNYNHEKKVKILLHYPCVKSDHIISRSKTNQKPPESYIKDMFTVLKKFKEHTESTYTDEKIEVRFYKEQYADWRYYVFIQPNRNKNLLFNHYGKNTPGAKSNMFNVSGGRESLCDYLDGQFDDIFDNDSVELVDNTAGNNRLVNSSYCQHPACKSLIERTYQEVFR